MASASKAISGNDTPARGAVSRHTGANRQISIANASEATVCIFFRAQNSISSRVNSSPSVYRITGHSRTTASYQFCETHCTPIATLFPLMFAV